MIISIRICKRLPKTTTAHLKSSITLSDKYGISKGKAEYISSIIEDNPRLTFEELAPLSINDISLLVSKNNHASVPESLDQKGDASEKAYIGRDKALANALSSLGISQNSIRNVEVDLDYENGRMIYEVDFDYGTYEYEIDLDATSGEIIKTSKEANDDYTAVTSSVSHNDHDDHDD